MSTAKTCGEPESTCRHFSLRADQPQIMDSGSSCSSLIGPPSVPISDASNLAKNSVKSPKSLQKQPASSWKPTACMSWIKVVRHVSLVEYLSPLCLLSQTNKVIFCNAIRPWKRGDHRNNGGGLAEVHETEREKGSIALCLHQGRSSPQHAGEEQKHFLTSHQQPHLLPNEVLSDQRRRTQTITAGITWSPTYLNTYQRFDSFMLLR